jgi:mannose-6-phosphate isomerase-like protein (cupin superfamily)
MSTVVQAADVRADPPNVWTLVAGGGLGRRLVDVPPTSVFDGVAGPAGELWFVISGDGLLSIEGHPDVLLRPDRGLLIPPAARYRLRADGQLCMDAVMLPSGAEATAGATAADAPCVARDLRDCDVETTGDRQFRVLFGPGRDCSAATQFVGEIPPGRAPDHSHPYDEVVLVLAGEGILHAGADHPVSAGACAHLPPGLPHCMENTGSSTMRVLGVFHPADSPAAKQ